jgi:hypothetical protein
MMGASLRRFHCRWNRVRGFGSGAVPGGDTRFEDVATTDALTFSEGTGFSFEGAIALRLSSSTTDAAFSTSLYDIRDGNRS